MNDTRKPPICLEHVSCDFCGGDEYLIRYRKPDNWLWINLFEYPVVECLHCGLVFINPRPSVESMNLFYPPNYFKNRDDAGFIEKYKKQIEYVPVLNNAKVLDIGCARGNWLIYLKSNYPDINCTGVDYYCDGVDSDEIRFYKKTLVDCQFQKEEFDFITAWSVLEHVHYPSEYFHEISRILKKGGKFVFLVTNSESLYSRRAYKEDIPRHLYHFSEKILRQYADKFGFTFSHIAFDDRIWDGRGQGTFYYGLISLLKVDWKTIYLKKVGVLRTQIGRVGSILDRIVFHTHWEARRKASGIIICEFTKS